MKTQLFTVCALLSTTILSGCLDEERTIYTICEDNPVLCYDIETKGWCKVERANVIRHREIELHKPTDQQNLWNSLKHWQEFSQCIEIAANIKRRSVKDRDSIKESTYLVTLDEIARIEKQTVNSELPEFLYYHWAQNSDETKINKLIALDNAGQLNTTSLQLMMASYYSKVDKDKAILSHYNALKLLDKSELATLKPTVFASLATHFYQTKDFEMSYVWAQIAIKAGLKANQHSALSRQLSDGQANLIHLNSIADATYDSIHALNFKSPKI